MDHPTDHSQGARDEAANAAERSRFLSAIGFGREPVGVPVGAAEETAAIAAVAEGAVATAALSEVESPVVAVESAEVASTEPATGGVAALTLAAKAVATEVLNDSEPWPWLRGGSGDDDGSGPKTREIQPPMPVSEGRSGVKPFTPLDEPEPLPEDEPVVEDAVEEDAEAEALADNGVALLADGGPDFIAVKDGMDELADELLRGFDLDDEPAVAAVIPGAVAPQGIVDLTDPEPQPQPGPQNAGETQVTAEQSGEVAPAEAPTAASPAMPWLTPRKDLPWMRPEGEKAAVVPASEAEAASIVEPETVVEPEMVVDEDMPKPAPTAVTPVSGLALGDLRDRLSRSVDAAEPAKEPSEMAPMPVLTASTPEVAAETVAEPKAAPEPASAPGWAMPAAVAEPTDKKPGSPWSDFSWATPAAGGGSDTGLIDEDALLIADDDDDVLTRGFGETLAAIGQKPTPTPAEAPAPPVAEPAPMAWAEPAKAPQPEPSVAAVAPVVPVESTLSAPKVQDAAWSPPVTESAMPAAEATTEPPFSAPVVSGGAPQADPAAGELVDLSCPQCERGLSLRREHLGIAGHCVWCQTPIVAAVSGVDGQVAVFAIGGVAVAAPKPALESKATALSAESDSTAGPAPESATGDGPWTWAAPSVPVEPAIPVEKVAESTASADQNANAGADATAAFAWLNPDSAAAAPSSIESAATPPPPSVDAAPAATAAFDWKLPTSVVEPAASASPSEPVAPASLPVPSPVVSAFTPLSDTPDEPVAAGGAATAAPTDSAFAWAAASAAAEAPSAPVEKLSDFLSSVTESGPGASALAAPSLSAPLKPFSGGGLFGSGPLSESSLLVDLEDEQKPTVSEAAVEGPPVSGTDLSDLAGAERASSLSQSLWPAKPEAGAGASPGGSALVTEPTGSVAAEPAVVTPEEPAAKPSEATPAAKPEKAAKAKKEPKPPKAPKAPKPPKATRTPGGGRRLVKVFLLISLLGLLAGAGATAFFWQDLKASVWPTVQGLVGKWLPRVVEIDDPVSELPAEAVEAALPAPAVGEAGSAGENHPGTTAASGSIAPTAAPIIQGKPVRPAFSKGPLRIQDNPAPAEPNPQ